MNNYERIGVYPIEEVLPYIVKPWELRRKGLNRGSREWKAATEREYGGTMVKMTSLRYRVFERNTTCAYCGLKGLYFALERHSRGNSNRYHFNLYGKTPNGEEVMLTKDHIVAKANGGTDALKNLQTLCRPCNEIKADNPA